MQLLIIQNDSVHFKILKWWVNTECYGYIKLKMEFSKMASVSVKYNMGTDMLRDHMIRRVLKTSVIGHFEEKKMTECTFN